MNASKCFWHCAKRRQHTKDTKLNVICQLLFLCSSGLFVCLRVWVCESAFLFLFISYFHLLFVFATARLLPARSGQARKFI